MNSSDNGKEGPDGDSNFKQTTGVTIERLNLEQFDEFIRFIEVQYLPRETMSKASGLSRLPLDPALVKSRTPWLHQGLSLTALDNASGRIVGVALNTTIGQSDPPLKEEEVGPPEYKALETTLGLLEQDYDVFEDMAASKGLMLHVLGVHSDYEGLGIAKELTRRTIQLADDLKLAFCKSNPTSPVTFHIFQQLNFRLINSIKLSEVVLDGKPAFPYCEPGDSAGLVVLKRS